MWSRAAKSHCGLIHIGETYDKHRKAKVQKTVQGRETTTSQVLLRSEPPLPPESTNLSRPDNARADQLIDLISDDRVLHVILERSRVGLSLLQDRLHDWVAHNLLYRKIANQNRKERGEMAKETRTATSGSRRARCMTSSSDSPSR